MNEGACFKPLNLARWELSSGEGATAQPLPVLVSKYVGGRFCRAVPGMAIVVAPWPQPGAEGDDLPTNPGHPACAECAETAYCRESWLLHVAHVKRRLETHWRRCDFERLCGLVPVVRNGRCLACVKLACPVSLPEEEFERRLEILDILVRDFVNRESDLLDRLPCGESSGSDVRASVRCEGKPYAPRPGHPKVAKALEHIAEHVSDPELSVGRVAEEVGIHRNYLSRLFAEQLGRPMSRFIAERRVELAQELLANTRRQIKDIAHATGHASANWFIHVFTASTGMSPGEYRRQASVASGQGGPSRDIRER